ncbi:antitoxin VbhA family protein [Corynebacterium endometrii]|uniref:Antitoxin VbhA domain-containing protein n=1 Tax=Corynebacterium endometrii TaxID=2488819 RepID=A0A4P7QJT4_9CORY|nr:antitoxin VbhA family protein [Corynebacterium endometrii]QCB29214.1 hypothetical protein CENDO_09800 [Corynebacterium endometrii]
MITEEQLRLNVEEAKYSNLLEGLVTGKAYDADAERYIAGEISSAELVERNRARYGLV